jgi:hypothetical protein
MDTVPLDLQRKCEQRWAARFRQPAEPPATPEHRFEKQDQQLTGQTTNAQPPPLTAFVSVGT